MSPKTKADRKVHRPSETEDAAINAGIEADEDTYEPTDEAFKTMRKVGRPKAAVTKERITIRLSPDVVDAFRATGKGWQSRLDAALKNWLKDHPPEQAE